jgi:hypothetical protein
MPVIPVANNVQVTSPGNPASPLSGDAAAAPYGPLARLGEELSSLGNAIFEINKRSDEERVRQEVGGAMNKAQEVSIKTKRLLEAAPVDPNDPDGTKTAADYRNILKEQYDQIKDGMSDAAKVKFEIESGKLAADSYGEFLATDAKKRVDYNKELERQTMASFHSIAASDPANIDYHIGRMEKMQMERKDITPAEIQASMIAGRQSIFTNAVNVATSKEDWKTADALLADSDKYVSFEDAEKLRTLKDEKEWKFYTREKSKFEYTEQLKQRSWEKSRKEFLSNVDDQLIEAGPVTEKREVILNQLAMAYYNGDIKKDDWSDRVTAKEYYYEQDTGYENKIIAEAADKRNYAQLIDKVTLDTGKVVSEPKSTQLIKWLNSAIESERRDPNFGLKFSAADELLKSAMEQRIQDAGVKDIDAAPYRYRYGEQKSELLRRALTNPAGDFSTMAKGILNATDPKFMKDVSNRIPELGNDLRQNTPEGIDSILIERQARDKLMIKNKKWSPAEAEKTRIMIEKLKKEKERLLQERKVKETANTAQTQGTYNGPDLAPRSK